MFGLLDVVLFSGQTQIQEAYCVAQQLLLDVRVEHAFGRQAGGVVDFDEPGLQVGVQHNVEAQNLKASLVFDVFGTARPVHVRELGLPRDHGLDHDVLDLNLQFFDFLGSHLFSFLEYDVAVDLSETSLVTVALTLFVVILHVIVVVLVDGVVGQMHVYIAQVVFGGRFIGLGRESCQAFLEEVDLHGVDPVEENVYAEVKLEAIDQIRWVDVVLGHHAVGQVDFLVLPGPRQKDAFSLAFAFWFDYENLVLKLLFLLDIGLRFLPFLADLRKASGHRRLSSALPLAFLGRGRRLQGLVGQESGRWLTQYDGRVLDSDRSSWRLLFRGRLLLPKLVLELVDLVRQNEGLREEIVVLRMVFTDHHEILAQLVFVGEDCDSGPLANPLVRLQLVQEVGRDSEVVPADVEVSIQGLVQGLVDVVVGELELVRGHERVHAALFEAFRGGDLAHHFVDCVVGVHDEPGRLFLRGHNRSSVDAMRPVLSSIHAGNLLVSIIYFKVVL